MFNDAIEELQRARMIKETNKFPVSFDTGNPFMPDHRLKVADRSGNRGGLTTLEEPRKVSELPDSQEIGVLDSWLSYSLKDLSLLPENPLLTNNVGLAGVYVETGRGGS